MRIVIFETEHFEAVYPVIRFFDCDNHTITIFCYQNTYTQLQYMLGKDWERYTWIVKPEQTGKISFIYQLYRYSRKHRPDILYLNTISNNFFFYGLLLQYGQAKRAIVTAHMVNNFFVKGTGGSFKSRVRQWSKAYLVPRIKEFNVISTTLLPAIRQFAPQAVVHSIPGGIYETKPAGNTRALSMPLRLVIPGSIDKKRRDYNSILLLAAQLTEAKIDTVITLLGKPAGNYGDDILQRAAAATNDTVRFVTYLDEVAQQEFEQQIADAHFLFSPLVQEAVFDDGITEVYGQTICSGNISDIIRHAKPFIIPAYIMTETTLQDAGFRYDQPGDITGFLVQVVKDTAWYDTCLEKCKTAAQYYTLTATRSRNTALLQPGLPTSAGN